MNILVELIKAGSFYKDAPITSLNNALKNRGFEVVYASDEKDLLEIVENNARVGAVILDWDAASTCLFEKNQRLQRLSADLRIYQQQCGDGCVAGRSEDQY